MSASTYVRIMIYLCIIYTDLPTNKKYTFQLSRIVQQEYIDPFDKSSVKTNTMFTVKTKTASMLSKNSKKVYIKKKCIKKKVASHDSKNFGASDR